jgi:hypothetical protein
MKKMLLISDLSLHDVELDNNVAGCNVFRCDAGLKTFKLNDPACPITIDDNVEFVPIETFIKWDYNTSKAITTYIGFAKNVREKLQPVLDAYHTIERLNAEALLQVDALRDSARELTKELRRLQALGFWAHIKLAFKSLNRPAAV